MLDTARPAAAPFIARTHPMPAAEHQPARLAVRLAASRQDVLAAQRLRHQVFFEGAGDGIDADAFDPFCDHLLVTDQAAGGAVVGTYRMLTEASAACGPGFYAARAFDLAPMLAETRGHRRLELGRACVLPAYRTRRTIELLWRGIWAYVQSQSVTLMFGCASLPGVGTSRVAAQRRLLQAVAPLAADLDVAPLNGRGAPPAESAGTAALADLPPLIKAYARLGARFSAAAVTDPEMNCTDVLVLLRVAEIDARYISYFSAPASAASPSR